MMIFEIRYPGTWIALEDRDRAWKLGNLLSLLEHHVTDAFVTFNLFVEARAQLVSGNGRARWEAEAEELRAAEGEIRAELNLPEFSGYSEGLREEADRRARRKRWESGHVPRAYSFRLPFVHAHSFLYALDGFGKALAKLAEEHDVPAAVADILNEFRVAFPGISDVRDSAQHLEDRSRGLGRKGKALKLKPVVNEFINAPAGGVLMLGTLTNDKLGYTSASGHQSEIAVTLESAQLVQTLFQKILDAFAWQGPPRLLPD